MLKDIDQKSRTHRVLVARKTESETKRIVMLNQCVGIAEIVKLMPLSHE